MFYTLIVPRIDCSSALRAYLVEQVERTEAGDVLSSKHETADREVG